MYMAFAFFKLAILCENRCWKGEGESLLHLQHFSATFLSEMFLTFSLLMNCLFCRCILYIL